jgi:hypothetical protein
MKDSIRSEREILDRLSTILRIRSSRGPAARTPPGLDPGGAPASPSLAELMALDRQGVCDLDEVEGLREAAA